MSHRNYSNVARPVILASDVDDTATLFEVSSTTGYPEVPFLLAVDRGTANEELLLCTEIGDTPDSFTVIRGYGGTTNVAHTTGALVEHVTASQDFVQAGITVLDDTEIGALTEYDPDTGDGNLWEGRVVYNTDASELQMFDGTNWLSLLPVGATIPFAGSSAPAGWLLANGQQITNVSHPRLHALLAASGYPFGGSGSEANVPDMRGSFPIGVGASGVSLGDTGGSFDHTHSVSATTTSEGAHTHSQANTGSGGAANAGGTFATTAAGGHSHTNPSTSSAGSHSHTNPNTSSGGSHTHTPGQSVSVNGTLINAVSVWRNVNSSSSGSHSHSQGATGTSGDHSHTVGDTSAVGNHTHNVTVSVSVPAHSHTNPSTSSAGAHTHGVSTTSGTANPPFVGLAFIIKF